VYTCGRPEVQNGLSGFDEANVPADLTYYLFEEERAAAVFNEISYTSARQEFQNHFFQILCNLAMEPPVRTDSQSIRDEKVKVLKAIPPIEVNNLVRGQFRGYRQEKGVAPDSSTGAFAALRLEVDSWRWTGVPFYIRAGKNLPVTCMEVLARLQKPPAVVAESALSPNHLRFRISPEMTIAVGTTVIGPNDLLKAETVEMVASRHPWCAITSRRTKAWKTIT
jgi:glucose-6-phosphate 1-dehydrogenase